MLIKFQQYFEKMHSCSGALMQQYLYKIWKISLFFTFLYKLFFLMNFLFNPPPPAPPFLYNYPSLATLFILLTFLYPPCSSLISPLWRPQLKQLIMLMRSKFIRSIQLFYKLINPINRSLTRLRLERFPFYTSSYFSFPT